MVSSCERREISNARTGLDCDGTQSVMRIKMKAPDVYILDCSSFLSPSVGLFQTQMDRHCIYGTYGYMITWYACLVHSVWLSF